jgi:hypothetical protein
MFIVPKPDDIDDKTVTVTDKRIWEKCVDEYVKRDARLVEHCEKLYSLILGQCTECMKSKLESRRNYDSFNGFFKVVPLIKAIKGLTYQFEGQRYHSQALDNATSRFYKFYQSRDMSNAIFLESFQTLTSVVDDFGGQIGVDPSGANNELTAEGIDPDSASDEHKKDATTKAKNRYLAMAMLSATDFTRYSRLLEDLNNDYTKGNDNYPRNITEAYNLIINYRQARTAARVYHDAEGVAFTNVEEENNEREERPPPKDRSNIRCFNCQNKSHFANKCPLVKKEDGVAPAPAVDTAKDGSANVTVGCHV